MKWAYSIAGVAILCISSVIILFFFEEVTISNEQDYYLIKEMTEAAMIDAIDMAYFRNTGEIKIVKEKFVENFTKRFAANTREEGYIIGFFDISEEPPKVTVKVYDQTEQTNSDNSTSGYNIYTSLPGTDTKIDQTSITVVNKNSGLINTKQCFVTKTMYSISYKDGVTENEPFEFEESGVSIYTLEGYTLEKASYITSFYESDEDNKELTNIYKEQFDKMYKYTARPGDLVGDNVYYESYAEIAMKNFEVVQSGDEYMLKYKGYARCKHVQDSATRRDGTIIHNVCRLGKIYDLVYKKNSEECSDAEYYTN